MKNIMKQKLAKKIFSALLQFGGAIAVSYFTSWVVGILIIVILWGHNIEKH